MKRTYVWLSMLLLLTTALFAQGTTGTLTGTVTTDGAPLPGVSVTIASPHLQGTRSAITGENGNYMFAALPPGDYTVTFELAGMQTIQRRANVALAGSSRVDTDLRVTAVAEAITVTAEAPAVLETTQLSANYTSNQVEELPMGRTIGATALLSPGVTTAFGRANQLQISGAPAYDNLILVNGVVVNENLRAQIHNLFIEDAIQETTVLSGGISAEYGRFTGGVVSTITKSGGNEFSGSLRDSLTNPDWKDKTPWANEADHVDELGEVYEATLGGYVLRDRLWFFGAGRMVESSTQNFTSTSNIPFVFGDEEERYEAKLTGQITDKHSLVGSYLDVARDLTNNWFGTIYDTRSLYNQGQPNTLMTVNYNGILTSNLLIEAAYSEKDFTFVGGGAPTRDRVEGTLLVDTSNGSRRFWSPTFCGVCTDEERNNDSQLLKATYYLSTGSLGTHTFVSGIENFAETRLVNNHQSGSDFRILMGTVRDGSAILFGPHGGPYPIFTEGTIIQWNPILFASPGSDLATQSFFINDKWDLNDRFTFNVGLRYDQNDATDSFGNTVSDDSEFSPRLGMTWDLQGNGKHRVNATYGRYVSKIMDGNVGGAASPAGNPANITFFYRGPGINTAGPYLTPDQALSQMWAAFDAAMPGGLTTSNYLDHPWFRSASIPGASTVFLADGIVSPSMDEITLGYGTAITPSSFVRFDYVMRDWNNFYAEQLDLSTGRTADGRGDRGIMGNTDDVTREYRGMHVQAGWRPNRFNIGGSYTYATLEGNDASEGEATATSPNTIDNFYPEYLGYAQRAPNGSLDGDVRHRLKAWAGYDFNFGSFGNLNLSAVQSFTSGQVYGASGTIDASGRTNPFTGVPTNPGYTLSRLGDQHTYWFTDRDAFKEDDILQTDLAVNYSLPIWQIEVFAQAEVFNVLNDDAVTAPNTTIVTRRTGGASSGLVAFNPFTETPVEGTHWRKGPTFGQPTGVGSYQDPREYRFSLGLRF